MRVNWKYFILLLILILCLVWLAVITFPNSRFKIIACDVGQGDAILATYQSNQILIDGGSGSEVTNCLSKYMPFWDREVEVVILTHPQADHFTGLVDVFKKYKVDYFIANTIDSGSQGYRVLKDEVRGRSIKVLSPENTKGLRVGLIYIDILWPSKEFIGKNTEEQKNIRTEEPFGSLATEKSGNGVLGTSTTTRDPNEFSIVTMINYKNFSALMTGDISPSEIDQIISSGKVSDVDYIKVPHHGSKNGLTKELLEKIDPEVAVISVGKNNWYGHPHEETLKMLSEEDIKIFRTDKDGNIEIVSDGEKVWVRE